MRGFLTGAFITLALLSVGLFWWQSRAQIESAAPSEYLNTATPLDLPSDDVPPSDAADMRGPAPPEATELSKEQRRFFRYDRNRDWRITRSEMLSTRSDGFRKLDKDGNNLLTFEEWAVATVDKFEEADADGNRELSPAEFATTKPKPTKKRSCAC